MKQKSLSLWLKLIITGTGICGFFIYVFIIPMLGQAIAAAENGAFDYCYHPWLFFIWMTGIPCYAGLVFAWRIAGNIGTDNSFSTANARLLKWISILAAGDAAFFFVGNIVLCTHWWLPVHQHTVLRLPYKKLQMLVDPIHYMGLSFYSLLLGLVSKAIINLIARFVSHLSSPHKLLRKGFFHRPCAMHGYTRQTHFLHRCL